MCPCPYHLAMAIAFLISFGSALVLWLRGRGWEMKLKRHDKCQCPTESKDSHDQA